MDYFFGLDHPAKIEDLTLLTTFSDPVSLSIAEELLSDAGIPFLKKERGAGGAVRIIAGFQLFATDLFVRPEDEDKAHDALIPLSEPAEFVSEDENDTENSEA